MDAIETYKHKGLMIEIHQDQDAQSPCDWGDDDLFLVHYHRDFTVENDKVVTQDEIRALYTGEESDGLKELKKKFHLFPVSALIHSGVWLKLGHGGFAEDSGGWDTSHVGAVLVSKKDWRTRNKATLAAESLIKEWNQYLSGDVYGFIVKDTEGEHLDSCWGFYGMEECKAEAESMADYHAEGIKQAEQMEVSAFAL